MVYIAPVMHNLDHVEKVEKDNDRQGQAHQPE